MKKFVINVLATTGLSLILLSVIALFYQAEYLCLQTVFQVFCANAILHFGFLLIRKSEIKWHLVETFFSIAMIIILLIVCGFLFDWFSSTPARLLIPMGFVIYIVSAVLDLISMRQDAREINMLIRKREEKE